MKGYSFGELVKLAEAAMPKSGGTFTGGVDIHRNSLWNGQSVIAADADALRLGHTDYTGEIRIHAKDGRVRILTGNASGQVYWEGRKPTLTELGAAPSGYGLGESAPQAHNKSGFFAIANAGVPGYPNNGAGFQSTYGPERRAQVFLSGGGIVYSRFSLSNQVVDTETPWAVHYTSLNKPSHLDVNAINRNGDTIAADLTTTNEEGFAIRNNRGRFRGRDASGALLWYVGIDTEDYVALNSHKFNAKLRIQGAGTDGLAFQGRKIFNEGYLPTASQVGAVARVIAPTAGIDLNKVRTGQHIRLGTNDTGTPEALNYAQVLHVNGGGDTHFQIMGGYANKKLWWRGFNDAGAEEAAWNEIYHTARPPSASAVGALPITGGALTGQLEARDHIKVRAGNAGSLATLRIQDYGGTDRGVIWGDGDGANTGLNFRAGTSTNVLRLDMNGSLSTAGDLTGRHLILNGGTPGEGGVITSKVQGGAFAAWTSRPTSLGVDCPNSEKSAYSIWKAFQVGRGHIAAMDAYWPSNGPQVVMHLAPSHSQFVWASDGSFSCSILKGSSGVYDSGHRVYSPVNVPNLNAANGIYNVLYTDATAVGAYMFAQNLTGVTVGVGGTVAGSSLSPAAAGDRYQNGMTLPGTWRACGIAFDSGANVDNRSTLWIRIA